mgnify:CR=1 FL=1
MCFSSALAKLGSAPARRKPLRVAVRGSALERHAGGPHNNADRVLAKFALVSLHYGIEPRGVIGIPGQHDFDLFGRFAHDRAGCGIAPLPNHIGDGQAVGKARRSSRATKCAQADALTPMLRPMSRPNRSSATCLGCCAPEHDGAGVWAASGCHAEVRQAPNNENKHARGNFLMFISRPSFGPADLQRFDLHPVLRRAKNDLTKAFVNKPAVSAIIAIAESSMIAYVATARLSHSAVAKVMSIQPIGFSFTSVRDTSWLS